MFGGGMDLTPLLPARRCRHSTDLQDSLTPFGDQVHSHKALLHEYLPEPATDRAASRLFSTIERRQLEASADQAVAMLTQAYLPILDRHRTSLRRTRRDFG